MKILGRIALSAACLSASAMPAQNIVVAAGITVTPATVSTRVTAPPRSRAPVVVAPISTPYAAPYYTAPAYVSSYTPNVVYFGGPYSHLRNYYSGHAVGCYPYSRVVCFGRGEAWERGYRFGRYR